MRLGVMTHHLERPTIGALAGAVAEYGLSSVQLNLDSAGLPEIPGDFDADLCRRIRTAFERHDITIAAVSGTFNMIDPDRERLHQVIERYDTLLQWTRELGCTVVTACTGTRNPASMWRHHPDNATNEAWDDLMATTRLLIPLAEQRGVTIAFEPEVVNVVDTAEKAQRYIQQTGSDRLRVVMDPANYFRPEMLMHMESVLDDIFTRVGSYIALAHAKDVRPPNPDGTECVRPAAGTGQLDYARYIRLLTESGYDGGLVMHSLSEAEVPASAAYVRRFLS